MKFYRESRSKSSSIIVAFETASAMNTKMNIIRVHVFWIRIAYMRVLLTCTSISTETAESLCLNWIHSTHRCAMKTLLYLFSIQSACSVPEYNKVRHPKLHLCHTLHLNHLSIDCVPVDYYELLLSNRTMGNRTGT